MPEWELVWNAFKEGLKHLLGKSITVYITYLGGATVYPVALNAVLSLIGQQLPETDIIVKVLIYGGAYKIWTDSVIPFVNSFFASVGVAGYRGPETSYAKIF